MCRMGLQGCLGRLRSGTGYAACPRTLCWPRPSAQQERGGLEAELSTPRASLALLQATMTPAQPGPVLGKHQKQETNCF